MRKDFSRQNIRGRSFAGQDLAGADFKGADIRGTNFTRANLRGADFTGAIAGLQRQWAILLLIVPALLAVISGLISALASNWITLFLLPVFVNQYSFVPAGIILSILSIYMMFFLFTIRQDFAAAVMAGWLALVALVPVTLIATESPVVAAVGAVVVAVLVASVVAVAGTATAVATASLIAAPSVVVVAILGIAPSVAVVTAMVTIAPSVAVAVAVAVAGLGIYIAKHALAGDKKYTFIRTFAIAIASNGGSSFRLADLTDANFTQATLKSTDFRKAILTRTCWYQSKKLDRIRPGIAYLQNPQVRQLLISGQGQDKNFDRTDLRGVYLRGANLMEASFIGANLSEANLQDTDLSRAKLVQTQLGRTDLTGATLTGACIEDWGITSETRLNGVRCEYVYMHLPTKNDPDAHRKPDNWAEKFEDGDFADFIKPIVDTLDLYHNQNVDPRAIAISLRQTSENHPEAELEIVAMEKRGKNDFLLRAKTALGADRSGLSAEYFNTYNLLKGLPEQELKLLIAEKEGRIRSLEIMIETVLQRPSLYSSTQTDNFSNTQISFGGMIGENHFDSNTQTTESQDYAAKYVELDRQLENTVITVLENSNSDLKSQLEQLQNLEATSQDDAAKFLELAGANIKRENERCLKIEAITGGLSPYVPIPVSIVVDNKPTEQDITQLANLAEQWATEHSERAGLLLYRESPDDIAKMEMAKVRLRNRFVLIPIPLALVEQVLPNNFDCIGLLEDYIERYLGHADFFDDRNAISDTFSFFGRAELLSRLEKELTRYQGVGLFGLRKSGKTSVLLQLGFSLREHPVIHIDLQRYGGDRYGAALFNEILQRLYTLESKDKFPRFETLSENKPASDLAAEFIRRFSAFAHAIQGTKYKLPILCFLDELERIMPTPEDNREKAEEFNACFGALRVLSQEQRHLALLVADVHPDCNRTNRWEQQGVATNPVFSFFKEVFLPPFSEENTQDMLTTIGKLMGLELDEETTRQIHRQSGGHPFVSRQLARFLTDKVKKEDVKPPQSGNVIIEWEKTEQYLEKALTHKGDLKIFLEKSIWEDLEKRNFEAAMSVLQVLACNESLRDGIPELELLNQLKAKFTKSQCLDACIWLTDVGLLRHEEVNCKDFYHARMPLLSQWIQMQMTQQEIEQCRIR